MAVLNDQNYFHIRSSPLKKGFKYEIAPNEEQKEYLNRVLGCSRFVYNRALAQTIEDYNLWKEDNSNPKPNVSKNGLAHLATSLRKDFNFLKEVPFASMQQSLINLGKAYGNFFKRVQKDTGFPKFKSKRKNRDSFRLTQANFKIVGNNLYIAKLKSPIKVFWSRALPSKPSSLTITKTPTGRYYVSFVCEYKSDRKSGKGIIGIDVGIKTYATTSKSTVGSIENPKYLTKSLKQLRRVQKSLSKKQKDSANRKKVRIKVAKLHEKISNQRKDFQHKLTTKLVNENQVLVIESLNVKGMIRNRKLSRAISDASWGAFFSKLKYKSLEANNSQLIIADPFYPSTQLCSKCNSKSEKKVELLNRVFSCKCGNKLDRDLNAALNLKILGKKVLIQYPQYKEAKIIMAPKHGDIIL